MCWLLGGWQLHSAWKGGQASLALTHPLNLSRAGSFAAGCCTLLGKVDRHHYPLNLSRAGSLVAGCCTLLGKVDRHHYPLNLSRAGSKRHTLGLRLSRRAKPREGVMLTQHH